MKALKLVAAAPNVRPPNPPWDSLAPSSPPEGCLSFYYSDPFSPLAVRHVTRRNDSKSDPNVETMTYGLFSTCERDMRSAIVRDGRSYLFFVTKYQGTRALTGYYRIRWYARGPPVLSYRGKKLAPDFYLAADEAKFIHPPIPLSVVAKKLGDTRFAGKFRTWKKMDAGQTKALLSFLKKQRDHTEDYVKEVHRLERLNMRFLKVRYVNWGQKDEFNWDFAKKFLNPAVEPVPQDFDMRTLPKGKQIGNDWVCVKCGKILESVSPLKRCTNCGSMGWIVPRTREA